MFDSSAEGCEAMRESPLMPLTVGSHALEAVLLSGEVDRCRGAVSRDDENAGETAIPAMVLL